MRDKMIGALYTLLSGALAALPAVRTAGTWGHRLVDFDQMGEAMVQCAGFKAGTFLDTIGPMRGHMARHTASGDLFLIALLKALRKEAEKPTHSHDCPPSLNAILKSKDQKAVVSYPDNRFELTARPSALHRLLPHTPQGYGELRAIPATERGMVDAIRRVQPLLSGVGVQVRDLSFGTRSLIRFEFGLEAVNDI